MKYSDLIHEHFEHPRHAGVMDNADADAFVSNPACGDTMHLYLRIQADRIIDASFQTMGCPAAIAASSVTTEMLIGRTLDESLCLTRQDVSKALGGLSPQKVHCSVLSEDAIQAAVAAYRKKQAAQG
jgi:nitrogen fixation NifU-like protein